jgi:hypothetical protein
MIPNGFFNQTISLYTRSSYDRYGREVVGEAVSYKARVQEKTKSRLLPNGQVIQIDAIAYVQSDLGVSTNDRIDVGSVKYKVVGKSAAVDGHGKTNHIKLELTKWQLT